MRRFLGILSMLFCLPLGLPAQTTDMGMQLGIEYSKKISNSFKIGLGEEIRFNDYCTRYDRFKSSVNMDYTFLKEIIKMGASYDYLHTLTSDNDYESRHRINADITVSQKVKQFKIEYRGRFQATFRDENRGSYRYNPKIYMRNRLKGTYSFITKPIKLFLSSEFFLRLYQPDNYIIDELRTTAGMEYRFDKRNAVTVYLCSSNEIQVTNPLNYYSLGIIYQFKH